MKSNFKRQIPYLFSLLIVVLMLFAARLAGEKEIIFPEVAALATGYMLSHRRLWAVSPVRMIAYITISALAGLFIVLLSPASVPVFAQMIFAYFLSQILFTFGGTSLAPFVSAICLPVLLQTRTFLYPISAFFLSLAAAGGRLIAIKCGLRQKEPFIPVESPAEKSDYFFILLRILVASAIIVLASFSGCKYLAAPPLLVAFTEFTRIRKWNKNPDGEIRSVKAPLKTIIFVTICAAAGAYARLILCNFMSLPLEVAALLSTAAVFYIMHLTRIFIPPAGAVTVLAMIIPEEKILFYPLQIFAGITLLTLLSRLLLIGWKRWQGKGE